MNYSVLCLLICIIWINSCHIGGVHADTGVLDDALFTFQDHACENDKLSINCPYGTTINIKWAQFGRTQPQNEICPFSGNFWNIQQDQKQTKNIQCLATTALQIVLEQCQDRHRCRLLASTKVFGQDPCPNVSKYLEVSYKCRPNEFRSRVVCDGEQLRLHCSKNERLAIYSASFGWSQQSQWASECADFAPYMRDCDSSCAYGHVHARCHGHKRCTLLAQDANFHSDCEAGTPKYMEIVFTCVKKRILQDIHDDVENPDPCELETPTPPISNPGNGGTENYNYDNQEGRGVVEEVIPNEGGTDINGQPSYLPKHSTITYDHPLTPQPEVIGTGDGNHGDHEAEGDVWRPEEDKMTEEPETGAVQDGVTGFVSDWIFTWNFLKENTEKLIMYVVLGVLVGIICVLLVIIIRLNQLRRRGKREAKLNISDPIANSTAAQAAETTSLLEPSDQSDGVEMTSYNQIGSMHRPPVSSFTDPYEEETPVTFVTTPINRDPHGTFGRANPQSPEAFPNATILNNNHGAGYPRNNHHHGNGGGATNTSIARPNHTRQTSFSGSLGRSTQPGTLTGSLNRRDHWTNEYRNEGHSHTLQHYYG